MAFIHEFPISDALKSRFVWTDVPLIYQGEAGIHCGVPGWATVDYERDLILVLGGGGVGRTTRVIQTDTEVFYFHSTPIRFCSKITKSEIYQDDNTNLYVFTFQELSIIKLIAPSTLKDKEAEFLDALKEACIAQGTLAIGLTFTAEQVVVDINTLQVEYI